MSKEQEEKIATMAADMAADKNEVPSGGQTLGPNAFTYAPCSVRERLDKSIAESRDHLRLQYKRQALLKLINEHPQVLRIIELMRELGL